MLMHLFVALMVIWLFSFTNATSSIGSSTAEASRSDTNSTQRSSSSEEADSSILTCEDEYQGAFSVLTPLNGPPEVLTSAKMVDGKARNPPMCEVLDTDVGVQVKGPQTLGISVDITNDGTYLGVGL